MNADRKEVLKRNLYLKQSVLIRSIRSICGKSLICSFPVLSLFFSVSPVFSVFRFVLEGKMVQADCAFRMGRSHLVCQDYAAAGAGEIACALLADGCSSSPDTDIGARLLVRSAFAGIRCLANALAQDSSAPDGEAGVQTALDRYHREAVAAARQHGGALGLDCTALDATLLTVAAQGENWCAAVFGDGVIAAKNRAGEIEVCVISYPGGYPFYPNYLLDAERRHALMQQKDSGRKVERFQLAPDGSVEEESGYECPADSPCTYILGKIAEYEWVAALSDGVHSFYETADGEGALQANAPVPLSIVLRELLAFKTTKGQFAQRRLQRFLRDCERRGWQHYDDISIAALSL